jgi:hypothetical protein
MNLLWGQIGNYSPPQDEKVVRNTTAPYDLNKPAAMSDDMPTQGEYESDSDPNLGMATRQLASKWHEGEKDVPFQIPRVDSVTASQAAINSQVSSSGTAAQREAAGVVNRNLSYAVGIEPVQGLTGGAFGNEYFVRNERGVQATSDNTMMLPAPDNENSGDVSAAGKANARKAAMAGMYTAFWNGGQK